MQKCIAKYVKYVVHGTFTTKMYNSDTYLYVC